MLKEYRRRKQREKVLEDAKKVGSGLLVGTATGALIGLLYAPKSGEETREDIKDFADKTTNKVKATVDDTKQSIKDVYLDAIKAVNNESEKHLIELNKKE